MSEPGGDVEVGFTSSVSVPSVTHVPGRVLLDIHPCLRALTAWPPSTWRRSGSE